MRSEIVKVTSELFPSSLNDCYIAWHKLCFIHFVLISHVHSSKCVCVCECMLSHAQLFATPWTAACPCFSVHGILQTRTLERVAISFSMGSSWPRDRTHVSCIGRQILYHCTTWEALTWHVINAQEFEVQKSTQLLMAKPTKICYTGVTNVISMTTQQKDKAGGKNLKTKVESLNWSKHIGYVRNITLKVRISVFYQMMFLIISSFSRSVMSDSLWPHES